MKRLLFILLPFLCCFNFLSAAELPVKSRITAVTVYRNLARESRVSYAKLPAGNTEVVIRGVTMQMLDPSIQVAVKGEAVLLSASVRTNYFQDNKVVKPNAKAVRLQDSIQAMNLRLRWIEEEKSVHAGELQLLSQLLKSGATKKEYKPVDLNACADIYRSRTMELKKQLFELQLSKERLQTRLNQHQAQLSEMGPKSKNPVKEIVLNFWADVVSDVSIKSMYLVKSAGWVPMYDLNVENTSNPVAISYKASVYQTTGMNWKNVDLTISTSRPGMNNDRPILSPKYVDYVNYTLTPTSGTTALNNMYIATNNGTDSGAVNNYDPSQYVVNESESDIHMDYDIRIKQNIPSDGKQHICKLKKYKVPATYRYHAVPKLESAAFLLARITDYGQYNLLAGQANVFFADTYIGQVKLNPQVTGDTLLVSLGRDESIVIKRTRVKEKTAKKIFADKQKENFAYKITVRNNKRVPIHIEVLDQIPLSRKKEIIVALKSKSGAEFEETYGRILWQLKIAPNKSKTVDLAYTIESPKDKVVAER